MYKKSKNIVRNYLKQIFQVPDVDLEDDKNIQCYLFTITLQEYEIICKFPYAFFENYNDREVDAYMDSFRKEDIVYKHRYIYLTAEEEGLVQE